MEKPLNKVQARLVRSSRAEKQRGDVNYGMRITMRVALALLALTGMTVSWLALKIHNQKPGEAPPCAVTERFDCGAVNHSRFAVFPPTTFDETMSGGPPRLHLPIAIVGLIAYGAMAVCAAAGWMWVLLELAQVGFLMAAFLSYLEAYVLEKWCIYCLWSQAIVGTILVVTAVALLLQRWGGRHLTAQQTKGKHRPTFE